MKLICPECRRENEVERIYCHDCGARLDRSALLKEKSKEEPPEETQRRLKSMLNPQGAKMRHQIFVATKIILGAIILAALVQMLRTPDLPPAPAAAVSELPPQINLQLEDAMMAPPGGPGLRYTEAQVNAYLAYKLKSKQKAMSSYLQFERAVAGFEEGFARFTVERSLFGYSIFSAAKLAPRTAQGNLTAEIVGGQIGRLPVHPQIMKFTGFLFSDVAAALDRDRRSLAKLGVELHPQMVVVLPKRAAL
ncbi:MAG: zinc ribbon domain-containing protein [Chthoniobacterales bacterium]